MPNYDLGTAHGRIRVDSDTRGSDKASRSVKGFERALDAVARVAGHFQRRMDEMERELRAVEHDLQAADRAAREFDRDIGRASRSTQMWTRDLRDAHDRLKGLSTAAADFGPMAVQVARFTRAFRNTGDIRIFNDNLNILQRSVRSFLTIGGLATVVDLLRSKFLGAGIAMQHVTGRQRQILQMAGSVRSLSLTMGLLGSAASTFIVKTGLLRRAIFGITNAIPILGDGLVKAWPAMEKLGTATTKTWKSIDNLAGGFVQAITGMALFRSGLNGLVNRFQFLSRMPPIVKIGIAAAFTFGEATVQLFAKALVGASNLLMGLLNGIKQLSGGFLALPGGIAMAITAFGTLKFIVEGLKDSFKDVFKAENAEELAKAIEALPPQLKETGRALGEVLPKWKELKAQILGTFVSGAPEQIRAISDSYLPKLQSGVLQVANSWRIAKDNVIDFLKSAQTQSDFSRLFMFTSQAMNQLSMNIPGLLAGFRDIGVVGAQFIRDLSGGLPNIVERFAEWARLNRENGNLMRWMEDAVRGAKDLVAGIIDASKAVWTLLTLFKTNEGDNFLARFADAMERFNNVVQQSASGGILKDIGDAVRNMGTDKIEEVKDLIKDLLPAFKDLLSLITDISRAFNDVFYPALKLTAGILSELVHFLQEIGGGQFIGAVLGMVAAWKTLGFVLGPIRNIIQLIMGSFLTMKGAQNIVLNLAGALENFGGAGKKASGFIMGMGDHLAGFINKAGIAIGVVTALWAAYSSGKNYIAEVKGALDDASKHADDFKEALEGAFQSDKGTVGGNVFSTMKDSLTTMMSDLKTTGDKVPGLWQNILASFNPDRQDDRGSGFFDQRNPFFQGKEFNDLQKQTQDAKQASEAFQRMGVDVNSLASIATGSQSIFDNFNKALRESGDGGAEASAKLQEMRDVFTKMQADFAAAGPAGIQLAQGIQMIGDAAGDSQTKLDGMKLALEGLGLLKTTYYEAAASYAEAVQGLGDAALNAVDKSQPLNDILDKQTGLINVNSVNGRNLINVLGPIGDKFLNLASKGENVQKMWQDMQPSLEQVRQAFGLMPGEIEKLIQQFGVEPRTVKILAQLEGKDKLTQDLTQVVLWAEQNVGKGINVPILVQDPKTLETEIEKIFGDIANSTDTAISFKFNVDPAALEAVKHWLASKGISLDGTPVTAPATIPTAPATGGVGQAAGPPPKPPEVAPTPDSQQKLNEANDTIADLKRQIDELNNKPAKIQIDTGTLTDLKSQLEEVKRVFNNGQIELSIVAKGYDETVFVVNQVKSAVTALIDEVGKIPGAFQTKLAEAQSKLDGFANGMRTAGQKAGDSFAQGLQASFDSNVFPTLDRVLTEFRARFHQSPPKKGPLAAHGDAMRYGGTAAASSYASGINQGTRGVVNAANYMAGAARDGMAGQMGPYDVGKAIGSIGRLLQFGQNFFNVIKDITTRMLDVAKFISDPLGQGTFFGKSLGGALGFRRSAVSDEELAKRRAKDRGTAQGEAQGNAAAKVIESASRKPGGVGGRAGANWEAIAAKESGGRWDLPFGDRDSTGGLQIRQGTWEDFGGLEVAPQPYMASKEDQIKIAERILAAQGPGAWAGGKNFVAATDQNTAAIESNTKETQRNSDVRVTGREGLQPAAENLLEAVMAQFPEIGEIGGVRPDSLPYHPSGRALDLMVGNNMELGDRVNKWLRANASALGLDSTIWRNTWRDMAGNASEVAGHMDHIHAQTIDQTRAFDPFSALTDNTGDSADADAQILAELRKQTPLLDDAIRVGEDPNSTDEQVASSLQTIQNMIDQQNVGGTQADQDQIGALESVKSSIMETRGFEEAGNPIDQAANVINGAASIAGDIFKVLQSGMEAWAAGKTLADMAIRYPANTEDVMTMIDQIQKFIQLGADIAGAISSITGTLSGMAGADPTSGGMGASAILGAISQIAGFVQAGFETANALIDLGQEAWRIFGSYFGQYLGLLAGNGSMLQGNIKYLLDKNAGQLYAYSSDNPYAKFGHNVPGEVRNDQAGQQLIGQVNNYMGPGQDPRDMTRNMLYQVKSAQYAGATGQ